MSHLTFHLFHYEINLDLWSLFGLVFCNALFTARVLVQWVASERRGESVAPVAFWWMSLAGTLAGFTYAAHLRETPFMIGFAASLVPYARNLAIHYRPDRPPRSMTVVVPVAVLLAGTLLFAKWNEAASLGRAKPKTIAALARGGNTVVLDNGWKISAGPEHGSLKIGGAVADVYAGGDSPDKFGAAETKAGFVIAAGGEREEKVRKLIAAHPAVKLERGGWFYLAFLGTAIFFGRFFIQWVHSERRRKSEMPMAFWMASFVGAVILLVYSLKLGDVVFILSYLFNVIPYARNMMLISRREKEAAAA